MDWDFPPIQLRSFRVLWLATSCAVVVSNQLCCVNQKSLQMPPSNNLAGCDDFVCHCGN